MNENESKKNKVQLICIIFAILLGIIMYTFNVPLIICCIPLIVTIFIKPISFLLALILALTMKNEKDK